MDGVFGECKNHLPIIPFQKGCSRATNTENKHFSEFMAYFHMIYLNSGLKKEGEKGRLFRSMN